jgi:hypothetical protein
MAADNEHGGDQEEPSSRHADPKRRASLPPEVSAHYGIDVNLLVSQTCMFRFLPTSIFRLATAIVFRISLFLSSIVFALSSLFECQDIRSEAQFN